MSTWTSTVAPTEKMADRVIAHMGTLVALTQKDGAVACGTVFTLGQWENYVICGTAAHVILEAAKRLSDRTMHPAMSPLFQPESPLDHFSASAAEGRIQVIFAGGVPRACQVVFASCGESRMCDAGLVVAKVSDGLPPPPMPRFAMNSDWLERGAKILVLGCDAMHTEVISSERFQLNLRLGARTGEITGVLRRGALVNSTIYRTNIALPPGWSGGPVLLAPKVEEQRLAVVGIVCSDDTPPHGLSDPSVATQSFVTPVVWMYGLYVKPDQPFASAVRNNDLGKNVGAVFVKPSPDHTHLEVFTRHPPALTDGEDSIACE